MGLSLGLISLLFLDLGLLISIIKDLKGQVNEVFLRGLWTCVYFSKFMVYLRGWLGYKMGVQKGSLWGVEPKWSISARPS